MQDRIISIEGCARCGITHDNLTFRAFTNPVIDTDGTVWAWYCPCPTNGEPILLRDENQTHIKDHIDTHDTSIPNPLDNQFQWP